MYSNVQCAQYSPLFNIGVDGIAYPVLVLPSDNVDSFFNVLSTEVTMEVTHDTPPILLYKIIHDFTSASQSAFQVRFNLDRQTLIIYFANAETHLDPCRSMSIFYLLSEQVPHASIPCVPRCERCELLGKCIPLHVVKYTSNINVQGLTQLPLGTNDSAPIFVTFFELLHVLKY